MTTLEERLAAICEHELLTPATHGFLVHILTVLAEAQEALDKMTKDCIHLVDILESRAEQEWNYKYQHERIAAAQAVLAKFSASPVLPINQGPSASVSPKETAT